MLILVKISSSKRIRFIFDNIAKGQAATISTIWWRFTAFWPPIPHRCPRCAYIDQTDILFNTNIKQMKSNEEYVGKKNETAKCSVANAKQNRSDLDYLKIAE